MDNTVTFTGGSVQGTTSPLRHHLETFWAHEPMKVPTKAAMALGYTLAAPALVALLPALRNPAGRTGFLGISHRTVILAELLGGACITSGWASAKRRDHAIANAGWVIGCALLWIRAEKKLLRQRES